MSLATLDDVSFVIDENLLRLGRAIVELRADTVCFGRGLVEELLPPGILDQDWIPRVGDRGWIVLTNDARLRTRPGEADLAISHHLMAIHLHAAGNLTAWHQAVRLLSRWEGIARHIETTPDGPWWLSVRANGLRVQSFAPGDAERI